MRAHAFLVTLAAALCANPALGAIRWEILNRDLDKPTTPVQPLSTPSTPEDPSADVDDNDSTSSATVTSSTSSSSPDDDTTSTITESSSLSDSVSSSAPTATDADVVCEEDGEEPCATSVDSSGQTTSIPVHTIHPPESSLNTTAPLKDPSETTSGPSIITTTRPLTKDASSSCVALPTDEPVTVTHITHSTTTTFYGDPDDYTPPFKTISTTEYCRPTLAPGIPEHVIITRTMDRGSGPPHLSTVYISSVTFYTTDKNPAVVFSSKPPPDFGSEGDDSNRVDPGGKKTAPANNDNVEFAVTAGPGDVTIGSSTISDLKPHQTKTVVVDNESFTILPSAIVGRGATVEKPIPVTPEGDPPPSPTSAVLGDLFITASGSKVVIDGDTITIPPHGGSMITQGETISFKPGSAVLGDDTVTWDAGNVVGTDVMVLGGELITAIGQSELVVDSTTLTYGPDFKVSYTSVGTDRITLDSSGVLVLWRTMGGPNAGPDSTTYQVVGGVTVTQMGASKLVIDGKPYTVGRGADETITTKIAGEMITIGPDGIVMNSMTMRPDAVTVTTIGAGATATNDQPAATGDGDDEDEDEDDSGALARPNLVLATLCLALGALAYA